MGVVGAKIDDIGFASIEPRNRIEYIGNATATNPGARFIGVVGAKIDDFFVGDRCVFFARSGAHSER